MEVCRRFLQQCCDHSNYRRKCKFAHPGASVEIIDNTVEVCKNFLRGRCVREDCKYFHPPDHMLAQEQQLLKMSERIPQQSAFGFMGGNPGLSRHSINHVPSHLLSDSSDNAISQILQLIQAQQEIRTELQQKHEQLQALQLRCQFLEEQDQVITQNIDAIDPMRDIVQLVQNNHAMIKSSMGFPSATALSTPSELQTKKRENAALQVCRDFLKDQCTRGESACKFAHVPSHLIDTAKQHGIVTICIDFLLNKCERPVCRFFHPPQHITEGFSRSNVNRSSKRQRLLSPPRKSEPNETSKSRNPDDRIKNGEII